MNFFLGHFLEVIGFFVVSLFILTIIWKFVEILVLGETNPNLVDTIMSVIICGVFTYWFMASEYGGTK